MRILVLLIIAAGAGWWWLVGSKRISEEDVHAHYMAQMQAFAERDAKSMCDALDDAFQGTDSMVSRAGRVQESLDKAKACANMEQFFTDAKQMESQLPGGFQIDTDHRIESVTLSADRKQATVKVNSVIKLGNPQVLLMKFTSEQTDTFVRKNGRLRLVSQASKTLVE
jgi:hypothetical protein